MKIQKKLTIGAAATLALAVALTGCTSKNASSASSTGGSDKITVAFVPKLQGIPIFEAMDAGGKAGASTLGSTWLYQGATSDDAAQQADIVRGFIQQKVSAIIVAPNDPDSIAPVLKEAQDAGIKVLTSDTDAPNSVRQVFVAQASDKGIGDALSDQLATAMGGSGEYAIVSCGETANNLNAWIAEEKSYIGANHPDMTLVDTVFAGEDQAKSAQMATDLINAHPNLKGIIGECTTSAPGVAQAVRDAGKIGVVHTVGVGTPTTMKPYLADGSSSASVLWDATALGNLANWAAVQLAQGKTFAATNNVSTDLPAVAYDDSTKTLLLGPPLIITTANVDQFNY
ncbi:autoinducer 2 ABC transporter substrate-binding protein [Subtercola endophyticus]|uniref:autoinducer 2 ABC transporter substrate-binding protein n=1 Tax=Subtercola endophyticus TaxID=2895559 RepID=UPI001E2B5BE5|nr:autoinducer 2 ABC transporter substrate-binding protein [Subtercola endophyticus]UFS58818.1 autoinducer 2 ABC transporter substrate-binding protein [Subtercola endophyticus]